MREEWHWNQRGESTVWWPIPGRPGFEMGDALEFRQAHYGADVHEFRLIKVSLRKKGGYPEVRLGFDLVTVHSVVALPAYGEPIPSGLVRHLDDAPENC